jgi:hypothetical protein
MGLGTKDLIPHPRSLIGFTEDTILPKGYVELAFAFRDGLGRRSVPVKFLVVDCPSAYNAILGRQTLNDLGTAISTLHLAMKFSGDQGEVITIRSNKGEARECYKESLKISKTPNEESLPPTNRSFQRRDPPKESGVLMLNLDPRSDFEYQRPQPEGDMISVQIGSEPSKVMKLGATLTHELRNRFVNLLEKNVDLFAWSPSDMAGIHPDICCHKLALKPETTPVAHKKRRMGPERAEAIENVLEAGFIREV